VLRNLGIPEEGDDLQPLTRIFNHGKLEIAGGESSSSMWDDVNIKQE
jgi:hypothetical protein